MVNLIEKMNQFSYLFYTLESPSKLYQSDTQYAYFMLEMLDSNKISPNHVFDTSCN